MSKTTTISDELETLRGNLETLSKDASAGVEISRTMRRVAELERCDRFGIMPSPAPGQWSPWA